MDKIEANYDIKSSSWQDVKAEMTDTRPYRALNSKDDKTDGKKLEKRGEGLIKEIEDLIQGIYKIFSTKKATGKKRDNLDKGDRIDSYETQEENKKAGRSEQKEASDNEQTSSDDIKTNNSDEAQEENK